MSDAITASSRGAGNQHLKEGTQFAAIQLTTCRDVNTHARKRPLQINLKAQVIYQCLFPNCTDPCYPGVKNFTTTSSGTGGAGGGASSSSSG